MRIILTPAIAAVLLASPVQSAFSVFGNRNIRVAQRNLYLSARRNVPYGHDNAYLNSLEEKDDSPSQMFASSQSSFFVKGTREYKKELRSSGTFQGGHSYAFNSVDLASLEATVEKHVQERVERGIIASVEKQMEQPVSRKIDDIQQTHREKQVDISTLEIAAERRVEKQSESKVEKSTEIQSERNVEAYPLIDIDVKPLEKSAEFKVERQTELDVIAKAEAQAEASVERNSNYFPSFGNHDPSTEIPTKKEVAANTVSQVLMSGEHETKSVPKTVMPNDSLGTKMLNGDGEFSRENSVTPWKVGETQTLAQSPNASFSMNEFELAKLEHEAEIKAAATAELHATAWTEVSAEKGTNKALNEINFHHLEKKYEKSVEGIIEKTVEASSEISVEKIAETYAEQYNLYFAKAQQSHSDISTSRSRKSDKTTIDYKANKGKTIERVYAKWRDLEAACERSVEAAAERSVEKECERKVESAKEASVVASSESRVEKDFPVASVPVGKSQPWSLGDVSSFESEAERRVESMTELSVRARAEATAQRDVLARSEMEAEMKYMGQAAAAIREKESIGVARDWSALEAACERSVEAAAERSVEKECERKVESAKEASVVASSESRVETAITVIEEVSMYDPIVNIDMFASCVGGTNEVYHDNDETVSMDTGMINEDMCLGGDEVTIIESITSTRGPVSSFAGDKYGSEVEFENKLRSADTEEKSPSFVSSDVLFTEEESKEITQAAVSSDVAEDYDGIFKPLIVSTWDDAKLIFQSDSDTTEVLTKTESRFFENSSARLQRRIKLRSEYCAESRVAEGYLESIEVKNAAGCSGSGIRQYVDTLGSADPISFSTSGSTTPSQDRISNDISELVTTTTQSSSNLLVSTKSIIASTFGKLNRLSSKSLFGKMFSEKSSLDNGSSLYCAATSDCTGESDEEETSEKISPTTISSSTEVTGSELIQTRQNRENNPTTEHDSSLSKEQDNKLNFKSRTQRIMEKAPNEGQTGGAGGVSTWESFLKAEANWRKLRDYEKFTDAEGKDQLMNDFVTIGGAPKYCNAWEKLKKQHDTATKMQKQSNTVLDFDIIVCGGTLGIFIAHALQLRGFRVCVVEGGQLQGREQEWNISMDELSELVELGTLLESDLDAAIKTEFPVCRSGFKNREAQTVGGYFDNGIGFECDTPDVLNLGVAPKILIENVKQRFLRNGGIIKESTPIRGITVSNSLGASVNLGDNKDPITSRLVLDCMGNGSPIVRQQRQGKKPDGVCCVVGSCAGGYDKDTNIKGDIIYTNSEIQDKGREGMLQYFWEAFPVNIGRNGNAPGTSDVKTTYMFTYLDADKSRPDLLTLMEDYWDLLPKYQPSIKDPEQDLDVKRVLFAFFPTYRDSPLKPGWDRILSVGDASGIQSPLSFGGFGALTRHLGRITTAISEAMENDCLQKDDLATINPYTPNLSAAWMFQKAMSVRPGQKVDTKFVNRLLATNFQVMDEMGIDVIKPFLQDVIRIDGLVASLAGSFKADPFFMPQIVNHVGIPTLVEWLGHVWNMGVYTACDAFVSPAIKPLVDNLEDKRLKFRIRRLMEAWKFGSGCDYTLPRDKKT